MTPELLAGIVGVVMSLLAAYVPWFSEWYNGLDGELKAKLMAWALLAVGVGIFALGCVGLYTAPGLTCDLQGFWMLLQIVFAALVGNQATFVLFVKPYQK